MIDSNFERVREDILDKLKDLSEKIEKKTPLPESQLSLDELIEISDLIEHCLEYWYY